MRFEQPIMLNLLWLVILLGFLFAWALEYYKKRMAKFSENKFLPEIASATDLRKPVWKAALLMVVFVLSILALARPQWGFEWQEVKRQGMDIFIVVDTSKSMLTQDVRPNRLERSKLAIQDFVSRLKADRMG